MSTYTPQPLDTSKVDLPEHLTDLLEELAKNTHDVWAAHRIKDGWRSGAVRNDDKKEHPGLVPYHELPESEKEYDRRTCAETLKAVLLMGYAIYKDRSHE